MACNEVTAKGSRPTPLLGPGTVRRGSQWSDIFTCSTNKVFVRLLFYSVHCKSDRPYELYTLLVVYSLLLHVLHRFCILQ